MLPVCTKDVLRTVFITYFITNGKKQKARSKGVNLYTVWDGDDVCGREGWVLLKVPRGDIYGVGEVK